MKRIEDLRRLSAQRKPGPRCGVGRWLDRLESKDREEWVAILADPDIMSSVIVEEITRLYGREVSHNSIGYHRRGRCLCQ